MELPIHKHNSIINAVVNNSGTHHQPTLRSVVLSEMCSDEREVLLTSLLYLLDDLYDCVLRLLKDYVTYLQRYMQCLNCAFL